MNKILGLALSILFIFEIFLFGIPLTTQAATLPPTGYGYAYYLPQNSTVAFVYNVNNITLSTTNATELQQDFAAFFNVLLTFKNSTYSNTFPLSIPSSYSGDIYFAYNPTTNKIEYVIILADVVGSTSSYLGQTVYVSELEQVTGLPSNLVISNNPSTFAGVSSLYSIPVVGDLQSSHPYIESVIQNPAMAKPHFFYEYIAGQLTQPITIGTTTISTTPTNQVLVFGPFIFVSPPFIITPEAPGFFNPLQLSGALGSSMQSVASTKPYIWGRALINTSIIDPYAECVGLGNGVHVLQDNLTFQLNYSVPGLLQVNMAQVGWVATYNNFPSSFTYLSYTFSTGYISFLGFIYNSSTTFTINGATAPQSGSVTINGVTYYVTLIAITPSGTGAPIEYFNDLTVYLGTTPYTFSPTQLPVYGYSESLDLVFTYQGVSKTITITVASTPTLTVYSATNVTLSATAYEGIMNVTAPAYYVSSPILSTPPSNVSVKGLTSFNVNAYLSLTAANAYLKLLTNATLPFINIPLATSYKTAIPSFDGIIVTPAYPLINGSSAMQYMGTAQYYMYNGEYEINISGSQIPMYYTTYSGDPDLAEVTVLPPFVDSLLSPSVPATSSGSGPLELDFVTSSQYTYVTLVELGIWSNETAVSVSAYSIVGGQTTVNKGYFYATIIPPRISTSPITPQSFECYNAPDVYIYDPDAILVPGNPTGSFTIPIDQGEYEIVYGGQPVSGTLIFYGSQLYQVAGAFGQPNNFYLFPTGTYFEYESMSVGNGIYADQLTFNGQPIVPSSSNYPLAIISLPFYADNNPTDNFYFEQSLVNTITDTVTPLYLAGLNISYGSNLLSPEIQPGYVELTPNEACYVMTNYVTFKILPSVAPLLDPYSSNAVLTVTPNASFVGATDYYKYMSADFAVYHYFSSSKQYEVQTQITVPNITATLYFASSETPLYASYAQLYFNESYYGANLPAYLALGTSGPLTWNAPNFEYPPNSNVYATPLYLSKMLYVNVTLPSGTKYTILLTTKNITTLFVSLDAQQLQYCNGTYEFEISIPGLESILNMNTQQLNGSTLTVSVWDYVTHETLVASTKFVALPGLTLVATQPGEAFYFLTFKASNVILTASTPWFIATSIYKEPFLNFTDYQYAHTNPTGALTVDNITVFHDGNEAMVYYNPTTGETVVTNVYGQTTAYTGDLLPTLTQTVPGSGIFTGELPFVIIQNNTVTTLTDNGVTVYTNGTLAIELTNGQVVPLGPAGYFLLPEVAYEGVLIGYNANVSVTVSDNINSITVSTYLTTANITPIRLAPIPTIPPIPHAPLANYYYNKSVIVTPTNPVINIYVTSVVPYPYEFYIVAIVRPGVNANTTAPVVYYSYQAVVAKPALGISSQPYIEVAVQMSGIISLPPGSYTIEMSAVPYATGPAISEYPVSLVFTNVTVE